MPCQDLLEKMEFEKMSDIYAHPLPRVYAIFGFAIGYSAKGQHTTTGLRAAGVAPPQPPTGRALLLLCVERWLNTQWQTINLHILLAEDGHIQNTCKKHTRVLSWVREFEVRFELKIHGRWGHVRNLGHAKNNWDQIPENILYPCSH